MSAPADRDRFARVQSEFDEIVDWPAAERRARVATLAEREPEVARDLEELLAADSGAGEFLSTPADQWLTSIGRELATAAGDAGSSLAAGERLGAWRLVRPLGRGGMGEVWEVERADGAYEQRAALKLLRRGLDSDDIVRRFRAERQILARLKHPAIARLYDGGVAPDGRPFYVLELVAGSPIVEACEQECSELEARLERFLAVCEAVEAAHRALIVHRDLKPSNILVSEAGEVKLLDFGIAKLLEGEGDEATERTRLDQRALTPAYAAPEQILGEAVTTATDVYSLGVVLYELLTGRRPHRRSGTSPAALAEEMTRETTERPSAALRRGTDGAAGQAPTHERERRARRLRGDLDWIVLRALAREPERRYPSAAALAADLRRHLDGRPVEARPDSAGYRIGKFVRRHRLAVVAALLVLLSLVGGLTAALVQAERARRESERARAEASRARRQVEIGYRSMSFFVSILDDANPVYRERSEPTLLEAIRRAEERIEVNLADDPEVAARMLLVFSSIELGRGELDRAEPLVERAYELVGAAGTGDPVIAAETHRNLGEQRRLTRRLDEAERIFAAGVERIEAYLAATPEADVDPQAWVVASNLNGLYGATLNELGRSDVAVPLLERAIALKDYFEPPDSHRRGISHYHLAQALTATGHYEAAERHWVRALETHEKTLGPDDGRLVFVYGTGVELALERDDLGTALARSERALAIARATSGGSGRPLAIALARRGETLRRAGRSAESRAILDQAVEVAGDAGARRELGQALVSLGRIALDAGDTGGAAERFRAARSELAAHFGERSPLLAEVDELLARAGGG